ncbi:MAG: Crp/Fnr family transcriptional regulator [Oscillospiraceae bacterium]|nr:Crp/Fnr family transcriptional regulator [Oscillospiraceae bacterium]
MKVQDWFPIWDELTGEHQERIRNSLIRRRIEAGTVIHNGSADCAGLLLVESGRLRAYILSDGGREITLYRLFDRDICLFSASCMLRSLQFDVTIQAEKDTELWVIPTEIYQRIMAQSAPLSNYTNEIMAARFSEVMWLLEQVMWKSMDRRVAGFLLEEAAIEGGNRLSITHEAIANHLGTHREVVTRMLRYLQGEGLVKLSRGAVELLDEKRLEELSRT